MRIHYYKDADGLWIRDAVGGVGILVKAETALNDKAYKLVKDASRGDWQGWGVVGTCEVKQ